MSRTKTPPPTPPPYERPSDALIRKTGEYWKLSSESRGRISTGLTMGDALRRTATLKQTLGDFRRLAMNTAALGERFVDGNKPPKGLSKKAKAKVINITLGKVGGVK